MKIDLNKIKKIYFIGIEGAGTSALAQIFKSLGKEVEGSDDGDHFYGPLLKRKKIRVFPNFKKENLSSDIDLVVYSTAFKKDNPELKEAYRRGLKILSYPQALALVFNQKTGIAICGTHGKTTTTALAADLLKNADFAPLALVGSEVVSWKGNVLLGEGEYFVLEADEYQNKLKYYNPYIVIVNNIDYDHPDFYKTKKEYQEAFVRFLEKLPSWALVIANNDDKNVRKAIKKVKAKVVTFGKNRADFSFQKAENKAGREFTKFYAFYKNKNLGDFKLKLWGDHNIYNALAVIALGFFLNIKITFIKKTLENFSGTKRRLQLIGRWKGAYLIDDYAHHPTEIKASLKALREVFPDYYFYCFFHPHSFSRTKKLLNGFAQSFSLADKVIVLDIYGSAREKKGNIHSKNLVEAINKKEKEKKSLYIASISEAVFYLKKNIKNKKRFVIITMGAGDVWKINKKLVKI